MNHGLTLVEMIVVLALFGLILAIAGLARRSLSTGESPEVDGFRAARAEAIQSGAPRQAGGVLFLPDGRAVGVGVDALTGAPHAK